MIHAVDVTYYLCNADGCEYKAKTAGNLKSHKAMIHDIDVTYYLCNTDGCEYKAKEAGNVKRHKAAIHDINVTYYLCNADGCEYKAKQPFNLKQHYKNTPFEFHYIKFASSPLQLLQHRSWFLIRNLLRVFITQ